MANRGGRNNNLDERRVLDDLIEINGSTSPSKYMKNFVEQQIADRRGFIVRMRQEVRISRNQIGRLRELIANLEASGDVGEVFDDLMELRDDLRDESDKVADINRMIAAAEEQIYRKESDLEKMAAAGNDG